MKKILCILLTFVLCANSVICVYADDHGGTGGTVGGGDHGGTGGTVGWDELQPVDHTTADLIVGAFLFPNAEGGALNQLSLLNKDNLDDDTKNYIKDNAGDNVRTDGNYYYINQNFIQNVNQKVQNRVHALNGYYLYDSNGAINYNAISSVYKASTNNQNYFDRLTGSSYELVSDFISNEGSFLIYRYNNYFYIYNVQNIYNSTIYPCLNNGGYLYLYDTSTNNFTSDSFIPRLEVNVNYINNPPKVYKYSYISPPSAALIAVYGSPLRVFYTPQDVRNYVNQGQQHYSPNLPNKTIKVPINYTTIKPTLNLDFDIEGKLADEIQAQLDLNFSAWLDKLLELSLPSNPTPTPGTSGGGSGGDHGGTGGTLDPTPTPGSSDGDGFNSDAVNYLEKIYNWLTLFGESHGTFTKKVSEYLEENKGKLDEIIVAINALGSGKTETESNGCKYDFAALSDFMTKLWNESDKKFDNMVSLLEENNKYQQKLVTSLNEIKAILVTQTVLELFENRSSETANKAKDKFPTSLPWDIAMVVNAMAAEPQEIKINLPIEIKSLGIHEEIVVDLTNEEWEKLAKTCRYLLSILFILFMIHLSRKMFFSGGDD